MALLTFDFLSETSRPFKTEDMEILKRGKNHFAFRTALSLFFFKRAWCSNITAELWTDFVRPRKRLHPGKYFFECRFSLGELFDQFFESTIVSYSHFSARQVAFYSQWFSTMGKPIERQRVCTLATKFFSLLTTQSLFTSIQFSVIKTVCWCVCLFSFVVVFRNAKPCCILPVRVLTLYANGYGEQNIFCCPDFFFCDGPPKPRALFLEAFPFQEGSKPTVLVPMHCHWFFSSSRPKLDSCKHKQKPRRNYTLDDMIRQNKIIAVTSVLIILYKRRGRFRLV